MQEPRFCRSGEWTRASCRAEKWNEKNESSSTESLTTTSSVDYPSNQVMISGKRSRCWIFQTALWAPQVKCLLVQYLEIKKKKKEKGGEKCICAAANLEMWKLTGVALLVRGRRWVFWILTLNLKYLKKKKKKVSTALSRNPEQSRESRFNSAGKYLFIWRPNECDGRC